MNNVKAILNKYAFNSYRYTLKNGAILIDTDDGHFVFKKKKGNNNLDELFKYLKSRSFLYLPKLVSRDDEFDIYEYFEDINTPREQRALDMMYILSLLHSKTTFYKEADIDEYKKIYEDIIDKIDDTYEYYKNTITMIENEVYMSPSKYLLARNISKVFQTLMFSKKEIENWYESVKEKNKKRIVTLHNNLDLDHLLQNENSCLVSWDNYKQGIPIYDILDFYRRYALEFDFSELLKVYESKYPLLNEERLLLFILMSIPDKVDINNNEINNCKKVREILDYIYKTEILITPYYTPNSDEKQD